MSRRRHMMSGGRGGGAIGRPIQGPLRLVQGTWGDALGPRAVLVYRLFTFLRRWHDDPDLARRLLDLVVAAGYPGVMFERTFGCDYGQPITRPDQQHWVDPNWAIDAWIGFGHELKQRQLVAVTSSATAWSDSWQALEFAQRFCVATRDTGLASVLGPWVARNEPPINGYEFRQPDGTFDESAYLIYCERERAIVQAILPHVLYTPGSWIEDEAPHGLRDFCDLHRDSGYAQQIQHASTTGWHRITGELAELNAELEPRGMNGPPPCNDVSGPATNDLEWLWGYYAMTKFHGFLTALHHGVSVVGGFPGRMPNDLPDFDAIPRLLAPMPDDLGSWAFEPGGSIIWRYRGNQMATVAINDPNWGLVPKYPARHWTIVGPDGVHENDGVMPIVPDGWKVRFFLAERA